MPHEYLSGKQIIEKWKKIIVSRGLYLTQNIKDEIAFETFSTDASKSQIKENAFSNSYVSDESDLESQTIKTAMINIYVEQLKRYSIDNS